MRGTLFLREEQLTGAERQACRNKLRDVVGYDSSVLSTMSW